jgi:hypothetical protein
VNSLFEFVGYNDISYIRTFGFSDPINWARDRESGKVSRMKNKNLFKFSPVTLKNKTALKQSKNGFYSYSKQNA